ncbi:MAG: type I-C CRISPR-associated protein Cas8c/Csd1 [Hyphomicrobiales bacterium]
MSILSSLTRAYDRLPNAPPFGFSEEKIGFCISLREDGSLAHVIDLRDAGGRGQPKPRPMRVPQPVKRTAGIAPNTFWDKTSYVLGVTAKSGKPTAKQHDAFVKHHLAILDGTGDAGLSALAAFLRSWTPERFAAPVWPEEMKDKNVVFALESERLSNGYLHDRPAAGELWSRRQARKKGEARICLITGEKSPFARLHPAIKGVWGGPTTGGSIVSFNHDAFTSYGHRQGENAPVSEVAAFKYTTVLNRFLKKDSAHRIQIGDASTVFWADASDMKTAGMAENVFAAAFMEPAEKKPRDSADETEKINEEERLAKEIGIRLERIRNGEHLKQIDEDLAAEDVRFFVLGLAPNAARLSVRFYFEGSFGIVTQNYQRFLEDMKIEPPPRDGYPSLWRYLIETAVQRKSENVPSHLAGDWMRAILSGANYPLTLLSTILVRIRADGNINALRAGMLKALLRRNFAKKEVPVALNQKFDDKGYLLGRLFAAYEQAQSGALGGVNATIKDRFYGAASAQPRKVFTVLDRGSAHHLSKLGKDKPGYKVNLEKLIEDIMGKMAPENDPFPAWLSPAEQAFFALGYYHQRKDFFSKKPTETTDIKETDR